MRHARELYYYCENCKAVVLLGSKAECSTCGGPETRLPTTDELLIAENEEGIERGY